MSTPVWFQEWARKQGIGGFVGFLDLFPNAAAAYSLRLLRKNYSGGLSRVRAWDGLANQGEADIMPYRVSSTEYLIDLNSTLENLDATAIGRGLTTSDTLADLVSTGVNDYDGLVSAWYDQSTNGNSATQSTATAQPKIVDAGSLIVDSNGFPEIKPDGINDYLEVNNTGIAIPDNSLVFSVSSYLDDADNVILSTVESTDYDNCLSIGNNFQGSNSGVCSVRLGGVTGVRGQYNESKSGYSANNKVLTNTLIKTAFADSDSIFNGNSADGNVSNRANVSDPGFFMFRAVGFYGTSPLNEVVVYDGSVSNQTANRTAAQSAIANFYGITL